MSGKWIFCRRAHQKWFSFSVLFFPSLFWSSQRALFRQSILRGGQCQFRCYCVNVSMAFPLFYATPYHTHHPSPITAPRKWFLLLVLQTELVVHTFHSNFHLAILSVWYIFSSPLPYRPPSRFFLFFFFAVLPPSQPTSSKSKLISSNQAHLSHVVRCQHFVAFPAMYTKNWLIKCKKSATCSV